MSNLDHASTVKPRKLSAFQENVGVLVRGGGITVIGKFFNNVIRLILAVILARVLGTVQLGYYSLALSTLNIAIGVALLGLDAAVVRFVAIMQSRDDEQKTWESIQIGMGVSSLLSTVVGILLFAYSYYLAENIFQEPQLAPYLQLASVFVPILVVNDQLSNILKGFKQFDLSVLAQYIYQPITRLVLTGVLLLIGLNAKTAIVAYSLASLTASAAMIYYLNRDFSFKRSLKVSFGLFRETMVFSIPVWMSSLLGQFKGNIQTLFIGSMNTIAGVGIFSVASQITFVSGEISSSINVTSKPIIAELDDRGDVSQMERIYQLTNKWILTIQFPIFLVMVLFPNTLLLIFGEDFTNGSLALIILAFGALLKVGTGMGGIIIDMAGYTKLKLFNSVLQIAMLIFLDVLLIPRWGLVGAAVAAVGGEGFVNILRMVEVYVIYKIIPYNISFYKPILATVGAIISVLVVKQFWGDESNFLLAGANIVIMGVIYLAIIYLLGFNQEEKDLFKIFADKFKRKMKQSNAR